MVKVLTTIFREFVKLRCGCFLGDTVSGCQQKIYGALFLGFGFVFGGCGHKMIVALKLKFQKFLLPNNCWVFSISSYEAPPCQSSWKGNAMTKKK
jgi:hypothetical protein